MKISEVGHHHRLACRNRIINIVKVFSSQRFNHYLNDINK